MLDTLVAGTTDAEILAEPARGRLWKKLPALREALDGRIEKHHRLVLQLLLEHIDFLEQTLAQLQQEIEEHLRPYEKAMQLLMSIPGIQALSAAAILAGIDRSRLPSAKHLASWAGLCPGNRQSGGKRLRGATTKGNPYLRAILAEVVWAISSTSGPL